MKYLKVLATVLIILVPMLLWAQGPGGSSGLGGDPGVPIDGGITLLAGAAVMYGAKKLRRKKGDRNDGV